MGLDERRFGFCGIGVVKGDSVAKRRIFKLQDAPLTLSGFNKFPLLVHTTNAPGIESILRHGVINVSLAEKHQFTIWPQYSLHNPEKICVAVTGPSKRLKIEDHLRDLQQHGNVAILAGHYSKEPPTPHYFDGRFTPYREVEKIEPRAIFALVYLDKDSKREMGVPQPAQILSGAGHKVDARMESKILCDKARIYLKKLTGKSEPSELEYLVALAKKYKVPLYHHPQKLNEADDGELFVPLHEKELKRIWPAP